MLAACLAFLTVAADATPRPPARETLAVMPLAAKGVPATTTAILDDLLVAAVDGAGRYKVLGAADINAMLGLEKMKDGVGCEDTACAAQIGGALGVRKLVFGSASKLGSRMIVSLGLLDTVSAESEGRAKVEVDDDENQYGYAVESAVAQLFGLPAPAPRAPPVAAPAAQVATFSRAPRAPSVVLWGLGAAALGVGAYFGSRAAEHKRNADPNEYGSQLEAQAAVDKARDANIAFAAGGVAVAAGLVYWLVGWRSAPPAAAAGTLPLTFVPQVERLGLSACGSF